MDQLAAESLVAAIGMDRILRPGPLKVGAGDRQNAAELSARIARLVRGVVFDSQPAGHVPPPPLDWQEVRERLELDPTPAQLAENLAALDGDDEALPVADAIGRAWAYLRARAPLRVRDGATGPRPAEPADADLLAYRRTYAAVSDPLTVYRDLRAHTITRGQVDALRTVYPAIYAESRAAVAAALADYAARAPRSELAGRKSQALGILLGAPTTRPTLAQALQEALRADEGKDQGPKQGGPLEIADAGQTATQRVEAR